MNIHDLFVPFEDELQLRPSLRIPHSPLIEWRVAFGDFFFRLKGDEPRILWCELGYAVTPKRPLPLSRQTTLVKRVSRAFTGRSFFRVVPFADGDDWVLVRPRRALVKSPHQPTGAWWQWNAEFPTEGQTQLQWLSQELDWFNDWLEKHQKRHRGLSQAREIARLSEEERIWAPILAPPEVREEWHGLAQALQLLTTPLDGTPQQWRISERRMTKKRVHLDLEPEPRSQAILPESTLIAALKLRDELTTRFAIPLDFSRWCDLAPNGRQQFRTFPLFPLDSDSMHQKMEAALLWRDFLRESKHRPELEAAIGELVG